MEKVKKPSIRSFRDLYVYQRSYSAMLRVAKDVIPKLPESEKYRIVDQLCRSSQAIPRLIAEGYAKRHQRAGFQKYIDDAMAETNETGVSLEQCRDLYGTRFTPPTCEDLITPYDILGRQLYKL